MVLLETYGVSCQNKFVKLVHLVGFIIKKDNYICFTGIIVTIMFMLFFLRVIADAPLPP